MRHSLVRMKSAAMRLLLAACCFLAAACITDMHGVSLNGLVRADGVTVVEAGNANGVVLFAYTLSFSGFPALCPDPNSQQFVCETRVEGPRNDVILGGIWDTTLFPDGNYSVQIQVCPNSVSTFLPTLSNALAVTVNNQPDVVASPPAPGPQDGPDASAPGARPDPVEPSPPQCMASVRTGNTEGAACDSPDPDNKRKDSG